MLRAHDLAQPYHLIQDGFASRIQYSDTRGMEGVLDRIGRLIIRRQELLASACRTPLQRLATGRTELARMRDLEACALATEYQ